MCKVFIKIKTLLFFFITKTYEKLLHLYAHNLLTKEKKIYETKKKPLYFVCDVIQKDPQQQASNNLFKIKTVFLY